MDKHIKDINILFAKRKHIKGDKNSKLASARWNLLQKRLKEKLQNFLKKILNFFNFEFQFTKFFVNPGERGML